MTVPQARKVGLPLMNLVRFKGVPILKQLHLEEQLLRISSDNWCIINDGTNAPTVALLLLILEQHLSLLYATGMMFQGCNHIPTLSCTGAACCTIKCSKELVTSISVKMIMSLVVTNLVGMLNP
ncbi:hypothetical protein CsSME_00005185 [Camellia sinensis var. sinensis]